MVATCSPQRRQYKNELNQRATFSFSLKENPSENARNERQQRRCWGGKISRFCSAAAVATLSVAVAAAAYFNQCTTTMIFIFMRQRNDLVSTYLNLHFNCLAHFISHSSSRAKSADARARALPCALPEKKRQESERQA